MQSTTQKNKAAVIVVTYNRADVSNLLFDSLSRAEVQTDYELIVIDNKSSGSELEKIERFFNYMLEQGAFKGRLIKSKENLGFPGGNNIGIREALADKSFTHLCLLNNDTIVADGWLDMLIESAGSDALVGPVSNSVGNEQIIPGTYRMMGPNRYTTDTVREFSKAWTERHKKKTFETKMLGFFCVLAHRNLFEKVGLLDEIFGIGTYEDDDYCHRCLEAGFKLLIARHIFVHHWGSASFGVISSVSREKLAARNQALFEAKHSTSWIRPSNTIPVALKQEFESADPEYFKELMTGYQTMLRHQIKALDDAAIVVYQGRFKDLMCKWTYGRLYARKGSWPKLLRLSLQFLNLVVLGEGAGRWAAKKAAREVFQRWGSYAKNLARHYKHLPKTLLGLRKHKVEKVLVFPISPFAGRIQRAQHLAREMAELGKHVIWINPYASRRDVGFQKDYLIERTRPFGSGLLTTLSVGDVNFENFYVTGISESEAKRLIESLSKILDFKECKVIVQSPFWTPMLKSLRQVLAPGTKIVYDCMDDHLSFGSATKEVEMLETALMNEADSIVTTSDHLVGVIRSRIPATKPVHLIRNATQAEHFMDAPKRPSARALDSRITVGYFGAIAEWFDHELMIEVAKSMPDIRFELIGNFSHSGFTTAEIPENLELHGEMPYAELPHLARHWSVGLIPFRLTPLILATNPVKLYEYSALGLPVVSTPIPEVLSSGLTVYVGSNVQEFKGAIENALAVNSDSEKRERREFAKQNTWRKRAEELLSILALKPNDASSQGSSPAFLSSQVRR